MTTYTITRPMWGADPVAVQLGAAIPEGQVVGLVLHHTVTDWVPSGSEDDVATHMRYLQRVRPDLGLEVPYSFVVLEHPDPAHAWLAIGRGRGRTGAHTIGYNSTRYGVAVAGNYTDRPLTPGMVQAIRDVGRWYLADPIGAEPTMAHRQVAATACPGTTAMGQLPELHPPFTASLEPQGIAAMTIDQSDLTAITAAVLGHPVPLRKWREDLQVFTPEPASVLGSLEFMHSEAAQANLRTQHVEAAVGAIVTGLDNVAQQLERLAGAVNVVAIGQARQSELLAALQPAAPIDPAALTTALVAALRAVLAPLVVAR